MIRKDVKNINIDYTNNNNEEVTNVSDNISNQNLNNYANYNSSEVEIVNFSLEDNSNNNDNLQDIDGLIKTNNDNFENITKLKKQMDNEYEHLEEQYNDAFSLENEEIWYGNGEIMSNGDRPMTPQEYENLLLGNYSQMYTDPNIVEAFYNDEAWQEKIKTYTNTYNKIFKKLTNSDKTEDEYKENMQNIKNDSIMLTSSQYALKKELQQLKLAKEGQNITNSQEYIKWLSNGSLSDVKLEEKYNEYQEQYLRIYDVPDLAYQLQEDYNPLLFCEYAKNLANKEGLDISDVINRQVVVYQKDFSKMYENYNVMTPEEIQIYSYLFENEGRASADKYIDKKQDELNQRIGYNLAQKEIKELSLDDEGKIKENLCNTLNVGTDGLSDGIDSFVRGLENAVINNENISANEYKVAYYLQYLQEQTKILDNVYQVGMSTGNMLPSVTASFITSLVVPELAPKVGQILMGASAYGNSKHEALVNGHSTMTSILYGLLSAGSEVLTEKMGGVLGLADNPSTNFIVRMLQEGKEEFIQSYLMAGIDAVLLNKPINLDELTDEAIKSFLMGAIVAGNLNAYSGALGGLSVVINNQKININSEQLNQIMEQMNENPDLDLKEIIKDVNKETSETEEKFTRYEELMKYFDQAEFKNLPIESQQKLKDEFQSLLDFFEKNIPQNNENIADIENKVTAEITAEITEEITDEITENMPNQIYKDYISEINIKSSNGEPVMVKVNDIDTLTIDDLERINDKDLVSFQMPNDEILSYDDLVESLSYLKIYESMPTDIQTKIEEGKLKDEILQTIKNKNYTDIEKIRKLYHELNKRVSYDPSYVYNNHNEANKPKNYEIYNRKLSFTNITSNKVICKGWSELFRELLISAGIPASQVNIVGGTKIGSHKWIEINLPNVGTIVADATENIRGSNDLINSKMGERTNGFIIKPSNRQGQIYRISSEYKNPDNIADLNSRMNAWEKVDESVGAIQDGKYRSDMLKEAKEIFGTSSNDEETNKNILNAIFMADVGRQLSGLEYYNYIKRVNSQVGVPNGIKARFSFFKGTQGLDAVAVLKYDGKYAAYSETYGKIVTNNRQKMIQYLRSINVSNADIEGLV